MSKKVIVIDDSQIVRQQVGIVLGEAGYSMIEAEDGIQGLDVIRANPDAILAICDVNMPGRSGIDMLGALNLGEHPLPFPVIMLTTEGRPDLIQKAKTYGAKAWMVKPFKPTMLLATLKKVTKEVA